MQSWGIDLLFESLIQELDTDDTLAEEAAISKLVALGQESIPHLVDALHGAHSMLRDSIGTALVQIGEITIPELVVALRDDDELVRETVAWVLGRIKHPSAIPSLVEALRDEDWGVRACSAFALGFIGGETALGALLQRAKVETGEGVQAEIAYALSRIRDSEAIPTLLEMMQDDTNSGYVRAAAINALALIGDPGVVTRVAALLGNSETVIGKETIHDAATSALKEIGTPEALAALEEWGKSNT